MINSSYKSTRPSLDIILLCFAWALSGCIKSKPAKFEHANFAALILVDHYSSKTDPIMGMISYPPLGDAQEFKIPDESTIAMLKTNPDYKGAFPDDADLNPLFTTNITVEVDFSHDGLRGKDGSAESLTLSNPVFDHSGQNVVVYYECRFIDERVEGVYALAESVDGKWQNFKYITVWH
jgi:hypothetical protein